MILLLTLFPVPVSVPVLEITYLPVLAQFIGLAEMTDSRMDFGGALIFIWLALLSLFYTTIFYLISGYMLLLAEKYNYPQAVIYIIFSIVVGIIGVNYYM